MLTESLLVDANDESDSFSLDYFGASQPFKQSLKFMFE